MSGLKNNPVFRATRLYLSEPADPRLFYENTFFCWVFIIEVSILKKTTKKQSRPYLKFLRLLP